MNKSKFLRGVSKQAKGVESREEFGFSSGYHLPAAEQKARHQ